MVAGEGGVTVDTHFGMDGGHDGDIFWDMAGVEGDGLPTGPSPYLYKIKYGRDLGSKFR